MQLKPSERIDLIERIGKELQDRYTFKDIDIYLNHFGLSSKPESDKFSKRLYVKAILGNVSTEIVGKIADDLGLMSTRSIISIRNYLGEKGLDACHEDFDRAYKSVATDPAVAIAGASSTLESICKAILDSFGQEYPKDESLSPLLRAVTKQLNLSPEQHANPEIKQVLGGLYSAGQGIGVLRTKFSMAHGVGAKQKRLSARHARLAVNACSTVGLFLLETYHERSSNR
jgi:hypothetical protein